MSLWTNWLRPERPPPAHADSEDLTLPPAPQDTLQDIASWHAGLIREALLRLAVPEDHVEVEVRRARCRASGVEEFVGFVRFVKWDEQLSPRALRHLDAIEARVRQHLAESVFSRYCRFLGIWFHVTGPRAVSPPALWA